MGDSNVQRADLVLWNGKIVSMDRAGTIVDAVAVSGDRIIATGARSDIEPLVGAKTQRIDLRGRVVLPGFIDTHVHLDCTATHTKLATSCHIPPVGYVEVTGAANSLDAILGFVNEQARQKPKGEWIIGQGRFSLETDGNSPTKSQLDEAAPDHPVMIRYSPPRRSWTRLLEVRESAGIPRAGSPPASSTSASIGCWGCATPGPTTY
jgi:predicted amidohydrolase YtcJ